MNLKLISTLFVTSLVSVGLHAPAIASVYDNVTREFGDQSHLILVENQSLDSPIPAGFGNKVFLQTPDGPLWTTQLNLTQVNNGTGGNRIYTGTFTQEIPLNTGVQTCTGDVTLTRTRSGRDNPVHSISMTRKFTGGYNCDQIGQTDNWNFVEAVPQAGDRGEYNEFNSSKWVNANKRGSTWIEWQLQRGISQLNCRATPNGQVRKVYRSGDRITIPNNITLDGGNAFRAAGQNSWLLTDQNCYVRANSRYIQPVSMPR
jgi:hypothetical protein